MRIPDRLGTFRTTVTALTTRRIALRALFTAAAAGGTAGALAPLLRAGGGTGPGEDSAAAPERFSEVYRGRRIEGSATVFVPVHGHGDGGGGGSDGPGHGSGDGPGSGAGAGSGERGGGGRTGAAPPTIEVRIDGRPLHIMRRADGSYLSLVNHYESFPTLRETARAAVDELGTAQLVVLRG
ncbi:tyrosinase family oxidase copper chaperone [Streptomyces sp. NPDC006798]|uniref:tyrosinase family oxidase copper chaperone n=1 Tax=Streptomyces sp. NPDC006798 TaxID=3155462 RepID=UPI0033C7311B